MRRWIFLVILPFILGCKTILSLGFYKDMALETSHNPWHPDSQAKIEYQVEKEWK